MEIRKRQFLSIPSLSALRAFEAAGRHLSFTAAAEELCVTPGAVSRQISQLEKYLHRKLFRRHSRGVYFTNFGSGYFLKIREAFTIIHESTPSKGRLSNRIVTLNVMQSLAVLWLFPLLARFNAAHPDIELRIIASMEPVDLESDSTDIAIRLGRLPGKRYPSDVPAVDFEMVNSWRGICAEFLAADVLTPVCAPQLVSRHDQDRPDIVESYCLLHNFNRPKCWQEWFRSQRMRVIRPAREIEFGHFFTAFEAARQGLGFAIIPSLMLSGISREELVLPFRPAMPSAGEYYVLFRAARAEDATLRTVIDWLKEQAARSIASVSRLEVERCAVSFDR